MILTCAEAINKALHDAMKEDPSVMVMGLGVNDPKRVFGTTEMLFEEFGPERVIETPCSEAAMTGVAIGAALMGMRPVLVHQRVEFALLTMEQIINNAAKIDYITCGKHKCPIVIRLIIGRGWGQGPTHSQSLEVLFAHIPGLTVLVPYDANSHYHLMRAAIRLDGPVIFFEHRWLHDVTGEIEGFGRRFLMMDPRIIRSGEHITLVSWGYGVREAMRAAEALAVGGIFAEVVAIPSLNPLSMKQIEESAIKTQKLLIIEMDHRRYGIAAEIAARILQPYPKILVDRLGADAQPTPSTRALAKYAYPDVEQICANVMMMVRPVSDDKIIRAAQKMMAKTPSDVPDTSFTGPF